MIHEAYMPVYMGSRFLARAGGCMYGSTRGSTRGPRGPNKWKIISGFGVCLCVCLSVITSKMTIISARRLHRPL